jgi:dihydrofolate reductase
MAVRYEIQGHAIVSDDDMIAGPDGKTPEALRNAVDWGRFQKALDRAAVTVLGRKAHEENPNEKRRPRIVLSTNARGIEKREDAWWWHPTRATVTEALTAAAPDGGVVVVPGGRRVFDLFLNHGFDEFHLVRARGVTVPGGVPIFTECGPRRSAEEVLASRGLVPLPVEVLDAVAGVTSTVWRRRNARI